MARSLTLYLLGGIVLAVLVNPTTAHTNRLNMLKDKEFFVKAFEQGQIPLAIDNFKWGLRYFREVLKSLPGNDVTYGNEGFCYYYLGQYSQAITSYQKAMAINPLYYAFHWDVGVISFQLGNYQDAIRFFANSLKLIPGILEYYKQLEVKLRSINRDDLSYLIVILKDRTRNDEEDAYVLLSKCYYLSKDMAKMRETLREGISKYPSSGALNREMGIAFYAMGQTKPAVVYLTQAVALDQYDEEAYSYRAICFNKLGDDKRALEDHQRFINLTSLPKDRKGVHKKEFKLHLNSERMILEYKI